VSDASDYRDNDDPTERTLTGLQKYANVTLKRGMTSAQDLWKWRKDVIDGKIKDARKNGQIILLDDEGKKEAEWAFTKGLPTKWTGPTFNAKANEVTIDTLEITHEGLNRVK
jgi:phage tail-like protein